MGSVGSVAAPDTWALNKIAQATLVDYTRSFVDGTHPRHHMRASLITVREHIARMKADGYTLTELMIYPTPVEASDARTPD